MSLPTLTKTWQFSVNNLMPAVGANAPTATQVLVKLKDILKGLASSPWTVQYSCDGTTAGTAGDGVDRWPSTGYTFNSNYCWTVLKQAGSASSNLQICIVCAFGGSSRFYVSPNAGFTGGTTSAAPTATDSISYGGTTNALVVSTVSANRALHAMQSTDGKCTRYFLTRSGRVEAIFLHDQILNSVVGLTYPEVYCGTPYPNPSSVVNMQSASLTPVAGNFNFYQSGAWVSAAMTAEGFYTGPATASSPAGSAANDFTGEWPMFPLGYFGVTSGSRGRLGTATDLWLGNDGVANCSAYPNDTSYQFAQYGNLILPWNGTVPVQE